jgi:CheY-like chemotaxis protein
MMPGRILVIDSDEYYRTELRIILQEEGHKVEGAEDGVEGLEKAKSFRPNLVITELLLDRLSGFEVASRIAAGAAGFSAPVIFYTGFYRDTQARKEMSVKYGAADYLMKPYQLEALKKRAADLLNQEGPADEMLRQKEEEDASREAVKSEAEGRKGPNGRTLDPAMSKFGKDSQPETERSVHGPRSMPLLTGDGAANWGGTRAANVSSRSAQGFPGTSRADAQVTHEWGFTSSAQAPLRPEPYSVRAPGTRPAASKNFEFLSGEKNPQTLSTIKSNKSKSFLVAGFLILLFLGLFLLRNHIFFLNLNKNAEPLTSNIEQTPGSNQTSSQTPSSPPASGITEDEQRALDEKTSSAGPHQPADRMDEVLSSEPAAKDSSAKPIVRADPGNSPEPRSTPPIAVVISDVTGASGPPFLRKSKQPVLSPELIPLAGSKPLVLRIMVDREGKILEATPLNLNPRNSPLSEVVLSAIRGWEFSPLRGSKNDTAAKYFSFKVIRR